MEKKLQKISYILQFTDSARFMASSLLSLVNKFLTGIHRIIFPKEFIELNINSDTVIKDVIHVKLNKYFNCFHEYINFKGDLVE